MSEPRWPDYELTVWDPKRNGSTRAGAAWVTESGRLSIRLNPGITLSYFDQAVGELKLLLHPFDKDAARAARLKTDRRHTEHKYEPPDPRGPTPPGGDEVPF